MNRVVAWVVLTLLMTGMAVSQSLGDVARQNRRAKQMNKKSAAHVFTNDDIPSVPVIREKPATPQSPAAAEGAASEEKAAEGQAAAAANKPAEEAKKGEAPEQSQKSKDAYRASIEEAKKTVTLLERELNVAQREHQIQTAVFYTDAGSRLRDPKDWTDKQKGFQDEMAAKTKALEDAKQKLQDLEEQARKSETATPQ